MTLYAENNQRIQCCKTSAPQIYNEKSRWNYLEAAVDDYIHMNGSFSTRGMNKRKDGVRYSDIAQFDLISKNLEYVMKKINDYNSHIEVQVQDGKLLLINKLSNDYIVTADN